MDKSTSSQSSNSIHTNQESRAKKKPVDSQLFPLNANMTGHSNHLDSKFIYFSFNSPKQGRIDEQSFRSKLLQVFEKDRSKFNDVCDQCIYPLDIYEKCIQIKKMIDYFLYEGRKLTQQNFCINHSSVSISNLKQQDNSSFLFSEFSSQVRFLSSVFSYDKFLIINQLHQDYQNIEKYLSTLLANFKDFAFTNEKEWIQMKYQIERCLFKYEKNVNTILGIDQNDEQYTSKGNLERKIYCNKCLSHKKQSVQNFQRSSLINKNKSDKKILRIALNQQKNCPKCLQIYKKKKMIKKKKQLNFNDYRNDMYEIQTKIEKLQSEMLKAIKNILFNSYEQFVILIQKIKKSLEPVCNWIQKAQKFEDSQQKIKILKFLLANRAKGVEGLIFLEQISQCFLFQFQTNRIKFEAEIVLMNRSLHKKKRYLCSLTFQSIDTNQQKQCVQQLFEKMQYLLNFSGQTINFSDVYKQSSKKLQLSKENKKCEKLEMMPQILELDQQQHPSSQEQKQNSSKEQLQCQSIQQKENQSKEHNAFLVLKNYRQLNTRKSCIKNDENIVLKYPSPEKCSDSTKLQKMLQKYSSKRINSKNGSIFPQVTSEIDIEIEICDQSQRCASSLQLLKPCIQFKETFPREKIEQSTSKQSTFKLSPQKNQTFFQQYSPKSLSNLSQNYSKKNQNYCLEQIESLSSLSAVFQSYQSQAESQNSEKHFSQYNQIESSHEINSQGEQLCISQNKPALNQKRKT